MNFHPTPASASGDALAGCHGAETAIALRRAKELRDAAFKLKVSPLDISPRISPDISSHVATDPETVSMVIAWAGGGASPNHSAKESPPPPQSMDSKLQQKSPRAQPVQPVQIVQSVQSGQRTPNSAPVSFWA